MLSKEQREQLKQSLLEQKAELEEHNNDFGMDYEFVKESMSELSNYDNHPADHGTELFEREKDIALQEHEEKEMQDIQQALQAMEDGSYGKCEICDTDIPFERLEAIPTTKRCKEHAENREASRDRPIEEEVLHSSVNKSEREPDVSTNYFDAEDSWQSVARYGTSETPSDFYEDKEHYNEMYFHSDELVSSVEEYEGFLLTNDEGHYIGVNEDHEAYEEYLDDNDVRSILYD